MRLKISISKNNIFKYLFYIYCFMLFLEVLYWFLLSRTHDNYLQFFRDFSISDWLINYEAGFIRRGLWGQIFLYLYNVFGINVGDWVYVLSYVLLFVFLYIFIKEWRRNNLSLFLLPSVCLLGAFSMSYLLWFRRDVLIFLLIWTVLKNYKSFLAGRRVNLFFLYFFSIVSILSHEASFFYFVPLMGLHYLLYLQRYNTFQKSLFKLGIFLSPILFVMLLCLIYKGDRMAADMIWHSWNNYFISEFGYILPIGKGCEALGWNGMETFKMHFSRNYLSKSLGIYNFCTWPLIFIAVYYLITQVNRIKIGINNTGLHFSTIFFSHIFILQLFFLLPMFSVLSCDFRRVFLYWTLSSFLFYFALGKEYMNVFYCKKISSSIVLFNKYFEKGIAGKKSFYILIFFLLGIPFVGFQWYDAAITSVFGNILFVLRYTVYFVYGV